MSFSGFFRRCVYFTKDYFKKTGMRTAINDIKMINSKRTKDSEAAVNEQMGRLLKHAVKTTEFYSKCAGGGYRRRF